LLPDFSLRFLEPADVVIATAWQTAEWVADLPLSHGVHVYFIQHKEIWSGPEERVLATWKLPLKKLVISRWLEEIASELGCDATYVPNGLDFDAFGVDIDPRDRDPRNVLMLYHNEPWKGTADGISALTIARKEIPDLRVTLFGVPPAGSDLPGWISYIRLPSSTKLRELYNEAAIFIAPSLAEGWGLPGSEAMICGAAVIATDIGGHREYCIKDETAVMVPPSDPGRLAKEIVSLCRDNDRRAGLAARGQQRIQAFTWEKSSSALEAALVAECTRVESRTPGRVS
jgi:glycosyltransferase involved in cell wall biosynthesis